MPKSTIQSFFNTPFLHPRLSPLHYRPTAWLPSQLPQTLYYLAHPPPTPCTPRQTLRTKDGGTLSLQWNDAAADVGNRELGWSGRRPLVFVMHGLTGGSGRSYVGEVVRAAGRYGYAAVAVNSRGVEDALTTPRPFTGSDFDDLQLAID
jgi:predicted alpha/beta-fold hydrolase